MISIIVSHVKNDGDGGDDGDDDDDDDDNNCDAFQLMVSEVSASR